MIHHKTQWLKKAALVHPSLLLHTFYSVPLFFSDSWWWERKRMGWEDNYCAVRWEGTFGMAPPKPRVLGPVLPICCSSIKIRTSDPFTRLCASCLSTTLLIACKRRGGGNLYISKMIWPFELPALMTFYKFLLGIQISHHVGLGLIGIEIPWGGGKETKCNKTAQFHVKPLTF